MGSSGCQPNPQQHVSEVLFPNQLSETEKHPKDFWEGESSILPCFLAHHHWTQPPWNNTISTQKPWRSTEKSKHLYVHCCHVLVTPNSSGTYSPSRSAKIRVLFLLCSPREEKHRWWGRGGKGLPLGSCCCLLQGTATALSDKWKYQVFCIHKQGSEMICLTSAQHSSQTLIVRL